MSFNIQNHNIKKLFNSFFRFLYCKENVDYHNITNQFKGYLSEPQLRFDLNPFKGWEMRGSKYPAIAKLALKYLTIPATSVISRNVFPQQATYSHIKMKMFVVGKCHYVNFFISN